VFLVSSSWVAPSLRYGFYFYSLAGDLTHRILLFLWTLLSPYPQPPARLCLGRPTCKKSSSDRAQLEPSQQPTAQCTRLFQPLNTILGPRNLSSLARRSTPAPRHRQLHLASFPPSSPQTLTFVLILFQQAQLTPLASKSVSGYSGESPKTQNTPNTIHNPTDVVVPRQSPLGTAAFGGPYRRAISKSCTPQRHPHPRMRGNATEDQKPGIVSPSWYWAWISSRGSPDSAVVPAGTRIGL
jgi:hypothetical protein